MNTNSESENSGPCASILPVGTGEAAGEAATTIKGVGSSPAAIKAAQIVAASKRPLDTGNLFAVGMRDQQVVIIAFRRPAQNFAAVVLSKDEAMNLAAWLAVMADPDMTTLPRLVEEIKQT